MSSHAAQSGQGGDGGHASRAVYWMIAGILGVLTAMEVGVYYMDLGRVETPLLLLLSAAKFTLVVMFFMHLKFDSRLFSGVFLTGLVLALFMVSALVVLYHVVPGIAV